MSDEEMVLDHLPESTSSIPDWARPASNETAQFAPQAGTPVVSDGLVSVGGLGGGRGTVNVDQGSVVFTKISPQVMIANQDVHIGGGGSLVQKPGEDGVSFLGQNALNVGGTDVSTALSGDTTQAAGIEGVHLAPSAGHLTNEEALMAPAAGDPASNEHFRGVGEVASGESLKRDVT